jgi:hemerythrin superfamily protein
MVVPDAAYPSLGTVCIAAAPLTGDRPPAVNRCPGKSSASLSFVRAWAGKGRTTSPDEGIPVDAITLLKDDHKTVEKLFKKFEKAGDGAKKTKQKLVDQITAELTKHTYIEETIFYPAARKVVPATEDHVLESVEEHHIVVWLLSELAKLDPSDETYDAKVTVLIENVRHHVEEEEQDWFPEVRKGMGRKALQELGELMTAAKADAPTDPLKIPSAKA